MKQNQFDYINRTYGLNLVKNATVFDSKGRHGQVTKADGAHIFIQWDNESKPKGPYHPTSELRYADPDLLKKES